MTNYKELIQYIDELKEPKKSIALSLLNDFCYLEGEIEKYKGMPRLIINKDNPKQQKKLPIHDILKDYQSQKNDIASKLIRLFDEDITEESAIGKILKRYE